MKGDGGMHPGVVSGRRQFPKANTCANRSKARLTRALTGVAAHLEQHPRDGMSAIRVATLKDQLKSFA